MEKKRIYLCLHNHRTMIGIGQQVDVIERVFEDSNEYELKKSFTLVPNEFNLIIEDISLEMVSLMQNMKKNYNQTKFILFITEYLTFSKFGIQLNTFDLKSRITQKYIEFLTEKIKFIDLFRQFKRKPENVFSGTGLNFKEKLAGFLEKLILSPLFIFHDYDSFVNSIELTRRLIALKKTKKLFDLVISNCLKVNITYSKFFEKPVTLVPTFIDKSKAFKERRKIELKKKLSVGCFFSGRLTTYRKKFLKLLYPINTIYPGSQLLFRYVERVGKFLESDIGEIPFVEIYIKQAKDWPYSSPMRTLMTIERGYIPLNIGIFEDHEINKCAIEVDKISKDIPFEIFNKITSLSINDYYEELYKKIDLHNLSQLKLKNQLFIDINNMGYE